MTLQNATRGSDSLFAECCVSTVLHLETRDSALVGGVEIRRVVQLAVVKEFFLYTRLFFLKMTAFHEPLPRAPEALPDQMSGGAAWRMRAMRRWTLFYLPSEHSHASSFANGRIGHQMRAVYSIPTPTHLDGRKHLGVLNTSFLLIFEYGLKS